MAAKETTGQIGDSIEMVNDVKNISDIISKIAAVSVEQA